MAEINQLMFSHSEVLELLIKKADLHDGLWLLIFNLGLVAGNFPVEPNKVVPGGAILINNVGLQRVDPNAPQPPGATVADAAKINPMTGKA